MNWANLWAPWRMAYLKEMPGEGLTGCFLCEAWKRREEDQPLLVLHRGRDGMILMNRYPYTSGHLMVCPAAHVGDLPDMTAELRAEMMELTTLGERVIQRVLNPQGVNIGINIGRAAGAGLPGHLHVHIVPRWGGDTNFINVVGQVRVIPHALEDLYGEMKTAIDALIAEK